MKMITQHQKMLNFANLEKLDSAEKISKVFGENLLNPLHQTEKELEAMAELQRKTRWRLEAIIGGRKTIRRKVLRGLVKEIPSASPDASVQGLPIGKLCAIPEIGEKNGRVVVQYHWLTDAGIHAEVIFGLVELFVNGLVDRLAQCDPELRGCGKFYISTPELRVACSKECLRKRRNKLVATYVKDWRDEERRKQQKRI